MIIANLAATTELEAVNAMLSAIGESAVVTVDTTRADIERAVNILRDKTRTTLNKRWKFNTEFGLAVSPTITNQAWTDPDGSAKTLYVFKKPSGVSRWELSRISEQASFDITERPSKVYTEAGLVVLVLYDRKYNRDGFEASTLRSGKLYLDVSWYFDFTQLPDSARRYITVSAARQFAIEVNSDQARAGFTALDEQITLNELRDDQGQDDVYSLLDSPDISGILGGRTSDRGYGLDERSNP